MKKIFFAFVILNMVLAARAETVEFQLGGKTGWSGIDRAENVMLTKGRFGLSGVQLTSQKMPDKPTELFISFDEPVQESKYYTPVSSSYISASEQAAKFGTSAAVCTVQANRPALVLEPKQGALFAGDEIVGSFTVSFWIRPEITLAGSALFDWNASLNDSGILSLQNINSTIMQNRVQWSFVNIWKKDGAGITVTLKSQSALLPEKWSHHQISYNSENGCLEYRVNGIIEAIEYLTDTGHEGGQILEAALGKGGNVVIGKNYSGLLDEFKISRTPVSVSDISYAKKLFEKLPLQGGRFESEIIDAGGDYGKALRLTVDEVTPAQTAVHYFIRCSNTQFNWTNTEPRWIQVLPNCSLENFTGRFFQIAAELYPNGNCDATPIVNSVTLSYEADDLPLPPNAVYAEGLDGAVEVSWSPSVDFDTEGYVLYYGERSGDYFYGTSPIDVGNTLSYKVTGLKNGHIYFFAVVAYDKAGAENPGYFSKEVWARPTAAVDCAKKVANK